MANHFKPRNHVNRVGGDFPETFQLTLDDNARTQMAKAATLMGLRPTAYMTQMLCGVTSLLVAVYNAGGKPALDDLARSLMMVEDARTSAAAAGDDAFNPRADRLPEGGDA